MATPDSVYGALVTAAGFVAVWMARSFVQQQLRPPEPRPQPIPQPPFVPALQDRGDGGYVQLSARDWLNIMAAIEKQFNGRYWLAPEARAAMQDIRDRSDAQTERLHERISQLGHEIEHKFAGVAHEMEQKFSKVAEDLKEKVDKERS